MTEVDRRTVARLLHEVKRIASHASLTGSLSGGTRLLIQTYNRCVQALRTLDDEQTGKLFSMDLFVELSEDASMDELGVAAALLASVVKPEGEHGSMCIDGREVRIPKAHMPHMPYMPGIPKAPKVKVTIHRGDEDDDCEHEDDDEDER